MAKFPEGKERELVIETLLMFMSEVTVLIVVIDVFQSCVNAVIQIQGRMQ